MKIAWIILVVSAFTDFVITTATAIVSAMGAMPTAEWPPKMVFLIATLGGLVSAARTIQQALKATPEQTSALKGN